MFGTPFYQSINICLDEIFFVVVGKSTENVLRFRIENLYFD